MPLVSSAGLHLSSSAGHIDWLLGKLVWLKQSMLKCKAGRQKGTPTLKTDEVFLQDCPSHSLLLNLPGVNMV